MKVQRAFSDIRKRTKENKPLIHCITNPISIKNCANVILAVGASPIMAEHPLEVEQITERSKALALNLGNITDARIESMQRSARTASENGIPIILDLVGISVSKLRLELAKKLVKEESISVIKGNMSEIKTMLGLASDATGVDVGAKDKIAKENLEASLAIVKRLAQETGSIAVASGKIDILSDGEESYLVKNGSAMLSTITGTGCMLTSLIASYLPASTPIQAALCGCLVMGVSGELAEKKCSIPKGAPSGSMSFELHLIDSIGILEDTDLNRLANWERREE